MKKSLLATIMITVVLVSGLYGAAKADDVPGHPRINEIDQRLENQQSRIDAGVNRGQINAKQEARDNALDSKVAQQLSADEAKQGGRITKSEQRHLNRELNRNSARIYKQRHKKPNS